MSDWHACELPGPAPAGCTCDAGDTHDPRNEACDKAILDGTARLAYYEVNPRDHQLTRTSAVPYRATCTCGDHVEGDGPANTWNQHLADVRQRRG